MRKKTPAKKTRTKKVKPKEELVYKAGQLRFSPPLTVTMPAANIQYINELADRLRADNDCNVGKSGIVKALISLARTADSFGAIDWRHVVDDSTLEMYLLEGIRQLPSRLIDKK